MDLFASWESIVRSSPAGTALIDTLREASHAVTDAYEREPDFWDRHHQAVTTDPTIGLRMLQTPSSASAAGYQRAG